MERPHRQGRPGRRRGRAADLPQRLLQSLLRRLQLAGHLRVQIAAAIDVAHEGVPRVCRLRRGELGALGIGAERRKPPLAYLQRRSSRGQLVERLLERGDPLAIQNGDCRDRSRGLSETLDVGGRQQEPDVARATELVDL